MRKEITLKEMITNRGCYSEEHIKSLFGNKEILTAIDLANLEGVSIRDKRLRMWDPIWELTDSEKLEIALLLAQAVAPIYISVYPGDNCVNDCWKTIKELKENNCSSDQLMKVRDAVIEAMNLAKEKADTKDYSEKASFTKYTAAYFAIYATAESLDEVAKILTDSSSSISGSAAIAAFAADKLKLNNVSYSDILKNIIINFVNNY